MINLPLLPHCKEINPMKNISLEKKFNLGSKLELEEVSNQRDVPVMPSVVEKRSDSHKNITHT